MPSRHEPTSPFFASQRWRYRAVVIVLGVITVSQFTSLGDLTAATGMWLWAINNGSTTLLIIAGVWVVVRWKHRRPWQALGFRPDTSLDDLLWSLRIGLGVVSVLTLLVLIVRLSTPGVQYAASAPSRLVWHGELGGFLAAVAVTTVLGPVAEELFFRGLAHGPLLRKFGLRGAAAVSGVLWSVAHYSDLSLDGVLGMSFRLILGICYAEVYRRRESLVPTVAFHIVGNTTAVFIRDPYLATLLPLAGIAIGLWIMSMVISRMFNRPTPTRA